MHIRTRQLALLALPTLIDAVSLSDMTPRAEGLPPMCNAVYTSQIWGCSPDDFQSQDCSSSCVNALYGLDMAIKHACANQGIEGQNLVVAFLAGVGPQQLCHNAGSGWVTTAAPPRPTTYPYPTPEPSIISSTTTARRPTDTETTLLVDTSRSVTETIPHQTQETSKTRSPSPTTQTSSSSTIAVGAQTSRTASPSALTTTTSAAGSSETSLEDHSGGGSPFDTPGNMNSASSVSLSMASIALSAAAAIFAALR